MKAPLLKFLLVASLAWGADFYSAKVISAPANSDATRTTSTQTARSAMFNSAQAVMQGGGSGEHTKDTQQEEQGGRNFFDKTAYEEFGEHEDSDVFNEAPTKGETNKIEDNATIDPGVITLIQSTFLDKISAAFAIVANYALKLLYIFAALELVLFALVWALQRDAGWDKLFFKIIKIGMILFVIENYPWLLEVILRSFSQLAGVVINNDIVAQYVLNPAKIWQYGYDTGIYLLKLATNSNNYGLVMVQLSLGLGILLVFGLLGIQLVVQMVGFYLVAVGALILLPFGTLALSRGMFDKAVQAVLQAGMRLMTVIIVVGIAIVVWDGFQLADLITLPTFNLNQTLGLFFTALLFLFLAQYLPKFLSQTVGSLAGELLEGGAPAVTVMPGTTTTPIAVSSGINEVRAATAIEATQSSSGGSYATTGGVNVETSTPAATVVSTGGGSRSEAREAKGTLAQASAISKSISETTVKKIKEAVVQAVKEKK